MHFLLKNSFFREVHFSRKPHVSFAQFCCCRDRGRHYLSRRICEITDPCPGIAIKNKITHNSYFRYKCEKVILFSWGRLRTSEARVKRPHEDKITFSLAYRTQFFYTTCAKLDLAHAVLLERAQSDTLRTEYEKQIFHA